MCIRDRCKSIYTINITLSVIYALEYALFYYRANDRYFIGVSLYVSRDDSEGGGNGGLSNLLKQLLFNDIAD